LPAAQASGQHVGWLLVGLFLERGRGWRATLSSRSKTYIDEHFTLGDLAPVKRQPNQRDYRLQPGFDYLLAGSHGEGRSATRCCFKSQSQSMVDEFHFRPGFTLVVPSRLSL